MVATQQVIIDGDGHVLEDMEGIRKFLPSHALPEERLVKLLGIFPHLDHLHIAPGKTPPGSFNMVDANGWVEFAQEVGIKTSILYPTMGLAYGRIANPDWAISTTRAYNDWLYETYMKKSPVLKGMGLIPMQEPDAAIEELRRIVKDLGMPGAMLPATGLTALLGAKEYWPIYREAEKLGCCLAIHGGAHSDMGLNHMNVFAATHALGHPFGLLINFASIVFNGIFDKFPKVKIAFMEGGVAWFLMALERFTGSHSAFTTNDPRKELLQLKPKEKVSDYIIRHIKAGQIFVGCEGDEPLLAQAVKIVGAEPFMFSSDFPHEVNAELCQHEIEELLENEELTAADKEAILHTNAARFYNLEK